MAENTCGAGALMGKPERLDEKSQIYSPVVEKSIVWDKLINVLELPLPAGALASTRSFTWILEYSDLSKKKGRNKWGSLLFCHQYKQD